MTTYYITSGRQSKMYTLRKSTPAPTLYDPEKVEDYYVCNLSTDKATAESKAKEITGLDLKAPDYTLETITKNKTYQNMPNGKYKGVLFSDVNDIPYLIWWIQNYSRTASYSKIVSDIKNYLESDVDFNTEPDIIPLFLLEYLSENSDNESMRLSASKEIKRRFNEQVDSYIVDFGKHKGCKVSDLPTGYLKYMADKCYTSIAKKAFEKEIEIRESALISETMSESVWIGTKGERISADVKVVSYFTYEGRDFYGNDETKYITKLEDTDGNEIIYFGCFESDWIYDDKVLNVYGIKDNKPYEVKNTYKDMDIKKFMKAKGNFETLGVGEKDGKRYFHTSPSVWGSVDNEEYITMFRRWEKEGIFPDINCINTKDGKLLKIEESRERLSLWEKDEVINIKFTVKEHSERDGVKQTIIQRPHFIKKI